MRSDAYEYGKRRHPVRKAIIVLLILAVAAVCVKVFLYDSIMDKISAQTYSQAIESALPNSSTVQAAESAYNQMSSADKSKVKSIILNHATPSNVTKVYSYLKSNDTAALQQFAEQNLTSSEKQELYALYEKYSQ